MISEYRLRGQLDALHGKPACYGCHTGMRSTLEFAKSEYAIGRYEVDRCLRRGDETPSNRRGHSQDCGCHGCHCDRLAY